MPEIIHGNGSGFSLAQRNGGREVPRASTNDPVIPYAPSSPARPSFARPFLFISLFNRRETAARWRLWLATTDAAAIDHHTFVVYFLLIDLCLNRFVISIRYNGDLNTVPSKT